ncbi:MAG: sigma-54 interaction domain-containing protein [Candidatus Binatales bacterium]
MVAKQRSAAPDFNSSSAQRLIGDHPAIVRLRAVVARVAPTDATVLITGESGTGKEVVARLIHAASSRRGGAFVPVNCAAIPSGLVESEMFGHELGAFTGAGANRRGLFNAAEGGTIFLDEVDELGLQVQAKLLRVLEDRMVRPVGSDLASRVDARVIAASNSDLVALVAKGAFREDLFYRLQVVPIVMPPLRERRQDIQTLTEHFLNLAGARLGRSLAMTREAMLRMWSYDWPGNVRELENLVERVAILCEEPTIDVKHLPPNLIAVATGIQQPEVWPSLARAI